MKSALVPLVALMAAGAALKLPDFRDMGREFGFVNVVPNGGAESKQFIIDTSNKCNGSTRNSWYNVRCPHPNSLEEEKQIFFEISQILVDFKRWRCIGFFLFNTQKM